MQRVAEHFKQPCFSDSTVLDNVIIGHRLHTKTGFLDALVNPLVSMRMKKGKTKSMEVLELPVWINWRTEYVENIPQRPKNG